MADKPRYYLTTAIAYPNGPPHIGHAYEAIATDAIARFMRLDGYDVLFVTGTDEHGIKMLQTGAKEKLTPPQLVERNVPRFKAMVERLDCSNDVFIRTTEERHHRASIAIWLGPRACRESAQPAWLSCALGGQPGPWRSGIPPDGAVAGHTSSGLVASTCRRPPAPRGPYWA